MAEEKTPDVQIPDDHTSHQEPGSEGEEYTKPWMRQLPLKFAKNEVLSKYDNLADAVTALLERPEKKEVPESYGLREGTEEIFKKAGLTKEEAKTIDGFYSPMLKEVKPDLKDVFKESYDEKMDLYKNGVKSISDDLADSIKKAGLDKDPVFVEIMARVGKETRGRIFNEPKRSNSKKEDPAMKAVMNAHKRHYGF